MNARIPAAIGLAALLAACGNSAPKHVFVIMMENHGTDEIIGNTADAPYINDLASRYGVASNYYGVTHPSLPNYLALVSGDFQGIYDDCKAGADITCAPEEFVAGSGDATSAASLTADETSSATAKAHLFTGANIVDQLETKKLTWKAYFQSIPGVGDTSEYAPVEMVDGAAKPHKLYAQKHNPFLYFASIRNDAGRMQKIVPENQLASDLKSASSTPNFVFIAPDQCHDMHGVSPADATSAPVNIPTCGYPDSGLDHGAIKLGDDYLKTTVAAIMASPAWKEGSVIAIPWDEDDYAGYDGCCGSPTGQGGTVLGGAKAPLIVIASDEAKKLNFAGKANHYTLLATIEKELGLPCLGNACNVKDSDLLTSLFEP